MRYYFQLLVIYMGSFSLFAQQVSLNGTVYDSFQNEPLAFANIRIAGTSSGTSATEAGEFKLNLAEGDFTLLISYIGYKTDTLRVTIPGKDSIEIFLNPLPVNLAEITVIPGENPALSIIRKAIKAKKERSARLNSFIFKAYTKGTVKTSSEISGSGRSISIGFSGGDEDSSGSKITGILENEARGYYKKPDLYKEEIIARKQTANFPPSLNTFSGGRLIQDFYADEVQFTNKFLPGPISEDGLDYYYFILEKTIPSDPFNVYEIFFGPDESSDPGFVGKIYIVDSLFNLLKVDVGLNKAANPGGIFNNLRIFQQFLPYENNIFMPIDYRFSGGIGYLGLIELEFNVSSILYNYEINPQIEDDFFDYAVITVDPEADKKEENYWKNVQTIPYSNEESSAYKRIDSLESIPLTFWDRFSPLSDRIEISENFSTRGLLWLYHFNRVEGHALDFGLYYDEPESKRFYSGIDLSYGFADKKLKPDFYAQYYLGKFRTTRLYLSAFSKIEDLFGESISYNQLTSTLFNLISKYDFRDYYYSKGFGMGISSEILPFLSLNAGFSNRTDNIAEVYTNYSFFNKDKTYRENRPVYETKINSVKTGFRLDFRNYFEDGYSRIRFSGGRSYAIFEGDVTVSTKELLGSGLDFESYRAATFGILKTFMTGSLRFNIEGIFSSGPVPYQQLYALPGNINGSGKDFSFRTLRIGEMFGDKVVVAGLEHNFRDDLFRLSRIPILKELQLQLAAYLNGAYLDVSSSSKQILPVDYSVFKNPFFEAGFSIGHILFPLRFEFTWKLNHLGKNNFVFGINTVVL